VLVTGSYGGGRGGSCGGIGFGFGEAVVGLSWGGGLGQVVVVRDGEGCFEGEGVVGYRCGEGGGGSEEYGYA